MNKEEIKKIKDMYRDGECPDCGDPIPDDVVSGDECLNCGHVFHEDDEYIRTSIPLSTLKEFQSYMEDIYNELTSEDMPDQDGQCDKVSTFIGFLKTIEELYVDCDACGKPIAPDEPRAFQRNDYVTHLDCEV